MATPHSTSILSTKDLTKTYQSGDHSLTVLDHVSIDVPQGATAAIVGPSGSGKTTLLGLCAGLDQSTSGSVELDGKNISNFNEDQRARLRSESVGFIFQNFQLMPTLTALENVLVPGELSGTSNGSLTDRAASLLERVGLGERKDHYPTQLSGGEQQRVAIARAFIHRPKILFADEPTGNLDEEASVTVESMLFDLNRESGTALVMVTHDLELAKKASLVFRLKGGKLVE
ncbi:ABC transporter ATP-binding protein [Verrucomicrobiaceae bacterium 5K15]|uniref:ABC transporter ATP-binding protein n=1 Tax=Oceaniferula flava TaxID=2800421 RepID=A0AAE2SA19_9BACT|nr:ABC transporter ATP-binding protein [Oceaniferula flavus]MBK1853988.1 ABC transporter ATP-binding protein [Oceaniferula flavus]MBM1135294.1 ABC transporter ATP-binding protein [Oceaniferula flavus]